MSECSPVVDEIRLVDYDIVAKVRLRCSVHGHIYTYDCSMLSTRDIAMKAITEQWKKHVNVSPISFEVAALINHLNAPSAPVAPEPTPPPPRKLWARKIVR